MLEVLHLPLTHLQAQSLLGIIDHYHESINYADLSKSMEEVYDNLITMNEDFRKIKKFLQQAGE